MNLQANKLIWRILKIPSYVPQSIYVQSISGNFLSAVRVVPRPVYHHSSRKEYKHLVMENEALF